MRRRSYSGGGGITKKTANGEIMAIACSNYGPSRKVHFPPSHASHTERTLHPIRRDERRHSKKKEGEETEDRGANTTPGHSCLVSSRQDDSNDVNDTTLPMHFFRTLQQRIVSHLGMIKKLPIKQDSDTCFG
jgi:hypothetical protein